MNDKEKKGALIKGTELCEDGFMFAREGSNQCRDTMKKKKRRKEEKDERGWELKMQHSQIAIVKVETSRKASIRLQLNIAVSVCRSVSSCFGTQQAASRDLLNRARWHSFTQYRQESVGLVFVVARSCLFLYYNLVASAS